MGRVELGLEKWTHGPLWGRTREFLSTYSIFYLLFPTSVFNTYTHSKVALDLGKQIKKLVFLNSQ
jgi:hypothetical protein